MLFFFVVVFFLLLLFFNWTDSPSSNEPWKKMLELFLLEQFVLGLIYWRASEASETLSGLFNRESR